MVFTFTMRVTLRARQMVTTAGSPSGTAATAREMAVISISATFRRWNTAMPNRAAQSSRLRRLSTFPNSPSLFCSGVISSLLSVIMVAICPSSVSMPVAVTSPCPLP